MNREELKKRTKRFAQCREVRFTRYDLRFEPMNREELKKRTKRFALGIMELEEQLPRTQKARVLINQLLRSSTSVGANYRSACRAKSAADFVSKIDVVEEEADETCFWLELMEEGHILPAETVQPLWQEANELTAIFTQISITTKQRHRK